MKKLVPIEGNTQKLDGGAMFGNVPKAMWQKWMQPDDLNCIKLACRALLVQEEKRNILFEAGIGAFFEPKLKQRFGVQENEHILLNSLKQYGLSHEDIDVVVLSHLHFDHAGGLLSAYSDDQANSLLFPNAKYLVSETHWQRAINPHPRDRASFIPKLNQLLLDSGRLICISGEKHEELGEDYSFKFSNGHTPGLMHAVIKGGLEHPVIFASDLIPATAWVHLPVTMGYDRAPEMLIDEKKLMLDFAIDQNAKLFLTHDPEHIYATIKLDEKGKYQFIS